MSESNVVPMQKPPEAPLFTFVNAEYLHDVWDWVRPRLQRVIEKTSAQWLPEDIYHAVKAGTATLATVGQDDGVIVLQRQVNPHGPTLVVWAMEGDLMPFAGRLVEELKKVARSIGCREIVQFSPRRYEAFGFEAVATVYRMEV